jgi:hypothetical protein
MTPDGNPEAVGDRAGDRHARRDDRAEREFVDLGRHYQIEAHVPAAMIVPNVHEGLLVGITK